MEQSFANVTMQDVIVTTAFELPKMRIDQHLGTTFGLVVRSMGLARTSSRASGPWPQER